MQIISRKHGLFKNKRNHALTCCGVSWTVWFLKITRCCSWNFCEVLEIYIYIYIVYIYIYLIYFKNKIHVCVYLKICDVLERRLEFYCWNPCAFPTNMSALACFHGSGSLAKTVFWKMQLCFEHLFFLLDEKLYEHYNLLRPEKQNKWKTVRSQGPVKELIQLDSQVF